MQRRHFVKKTQNTKTPPPTPRHLPSPPIYVLGIKNCRNFEYSQKKYFAGVIDKTRPLTISGAYHPKLARCRIAISEGPVEDWQKKTGSETEACISNHVFVKKKF